MKPPILRDDTWSHPNGSYFNSDALLARIRGYGSFFDGNSIDPIAADRAFIHETIHWCQYLGTSFGVGLILQRWAQYDLAVNMLAQVDESVRVRALECRANGIPIVSIDPNGRYVGCNVDHPLIESLSRAWHAQILTDRIITDSGSLDRSIRLPFAFELLIGDYLIDVAGSPVLFGEPESLPSHPQGCVMDAPIGVDHLFTTRAIMECGALINEYATYIGSGAAREARRESCLRQLLGPGIYGAAASTFCKIIRCRREDLPEWFGTILVLCDLALNPVTAPLLTLSDALAEPISWSEFSPPWRFIRGAEICRRLEACSLQDLPDRCRQLSHDIAEMAGLCHWRGTSYKFQELPPFLEVLASFDLNGGAPINGERAILSFLRSVAISMWQERHENELSVFAMGVIGQSLKDGTWWLSPPLITEEKHTRFWHPKPLSSPTTLPFVTMLMSRYLTPDLLGGVGPVDLSVFPAGLNDRKPGALAGLGFGSLVDRIPIKLQP